MEWVKRKPITPYKDSDSVTEKLAKINGIKDIDEYLRPSEKSLHDPYLLGNVEDAANEILLAINKGLKIGVSFDVDADGLTSGSMMYRFIKQFTDNVYYLFAERSDGHGIEMQLKMVQDDTNLLVICDSSTNSAEACRYLKEEKGIKIVILDHHIQEEKNPHALIVNPQLDNYPNKELSGAGVVYKTIKVMDDSLMSGSADDYLDLVATGMCADMMSVKIPENRYLISKGLKNIQNKGLEAILKVAKQDKNKATSQTIGFTIGPMLNGAARMDKLETAIKLLIEDDEKTCGKYAKEIKALNDNRKKLESEIFESIKPNIDNSDKVIIVIAENVEKGFNGLIATKIANAYQKPVIVVREENNDDGTEDSIKLSGSYRTYGSFDMKGFLETFHISKFVRGHTGAGGYSFKKKHLGKLKALMNEKLKNIQFESELEYDLEVTSKEANLNFIREVERFNWITGKDVPTAKFLIRNLGIIDDPEILGTNKDTIKLLCSNNICLMKFRTSNAEEFAEQFDPFSRVDVVGMLNVNEFYNWGKREWKITNQLFIEDIKIK